MTLIPQTNPPPTPLALLHGESGERMDALETLAGQCGFRTRRSNDPLPQNGEALLILVAGPDPAETLDRWQVARARCPRLLGLVAGQTLDAPRVACAYRKGILDVLLDEDGTDAWRERLEYALLLAEHEQRLQGLRLNIAQQEGAPVAISPAMARVIRQIEQVAPTPLPVLLNGETGTGKGVLARHIHARSLRASGPFLAVNCGAIAPSLLESELFGHEKGAFTGAHARRIGLLEAADGGTLFLDEINSAPIELQVRLLRFIQEKRFMRVGNTQDIEVDVRLICASNQPLQPLVDTRQFREDLFYRINVFPIDVPPLRQRREDIPPLAAQILIRHAQLLDKTVNACGPGVLDTLCRHDWPGNVRELENAILRALVIASSERIELRDLPPEILHPTRRVEARTAPWRGDASLAEVEHHWIRHTLEQCGGNRTQAARRLGIDPSTLWRKLRERPPV